MQLTLLLIVLAIVGVGGVIVVAVWWSMADKWFPDVSRKTGQGSPLSMLKRDDHREEGPPPVVVRADEPPADDAERTS